MVLASHYPYYMLSIRSIDKEVPGKNYLRPYMSSGLLTWDYDIAIIVGGRTKNTLQHFVEVLP